MSKLYDIKESKFVLKIENLIENGNIYEKSKF